MTEKDLSAVRRPRASVKPSEPQFYNFTTEEACRVHEMKIHMDVHAMCATTDKA